VARNRKRAKDRRPRRPPQGGGSGAGVPSDRSSIPGVLPPVPTVTDEPSLEPEDNGAREPVEPELVLEPEDSDPADPLRHAAPQAELAEAQLAYGAVPVPEGVDEADDAEFEQEVEESIAETRRGRRGRRSGGDGSGGGGGAAGSAVEVAAPGAVAAEGRPGIFARLIGFLQGSWRELQRVQWPDRRQVMQATGVVIGFVIVAAVFLGVADWAAGKVVTFLLK
jgi:preprotein translocase subunit SecE